MDQIKFVDLLRSRELYFHRLDLFEDKLEGTLSASEFARIKRLTDGSTAFEGRHFDAYMYPFRTARLSQYASCWHMNKSESVAMWKLYAPKDGSAVAIRSTYEKLRDSLPSRLTPPQHLGVFLGAVTYGDFNSINSDLKNGFELTTRKRSAFAHEQECRAMIWRVDDSRSLKSLTQFDDLQALAERNPTGIRAPVDLESLIQSVVVSPLAPDARTWIEEALKTYEFNFPVTESRLSDPGNI